MTAGQCLTVRIRCSTWGQLAATYRRDLVRGVLFLRSSNPPALGTPIRINVTLPSETLIMMTGVVHDHIKSPDRGAGLEIKLDPIPPSAMWIIESALSSLVKHTASQVTKMPAAPREPVLESGCAIPNAEQQLVSALAEELDALSRLNAFQVLGIGYVCQDHEVRSAFGNLTRKYHPDRFAQYQDARIREYSSELFILVRDAYRQLGTAELRAKAVAAIRNRSETRNSSRGRANPDPPPIPPQAFDVRPPSIPQRSTHNTEEVSKQHASPNLSLKQAQRLLDEGRYEEAQLLFSRATKQSPEPPLARAGTYLCDGLRALARGDRFAAAQCFEAALDTEPDNQRAAQELAEMRRQATNDRKGHLARLRGKEE